MKLEIGKWYEDGLGQQIKLISDELTGNYRLVGLVHALEGIMVGVYTTEGNFYADLSDRSRDIVHELDPLCDNKIQKWILLEGAEILHLGTSYELGFFSRADFTSVDAAVRGNGIDTSATAIRGHRNLHDNYESARAMARFLRRNNSVEYVYRVVN